MAKRMRSVMDPDPLLTWCRRGLRLLYVLYVILMALLILLAFKQRYHP